MILNSESFWSNVATYKKNCQKKFHAVEFTAQYFYLRWFCTHWERLWSCFRGYKKKRPTASYIREEDWKKPGALRGFGIHAYEETKEKIENTYSIVFGTEVEMASSIFLSIQSAFFFSF